MKQSKVENKIEATKAFAHNNINYQSLNHDLQWKIGTINFFPTTHKWHDQKNGRTGNGLITAIKYIKGSEILENTKINKNHLSVEQLFHIASHSKDRSLEGICKALHKEIYND